MKSIITFILSFAFSSIITAQVKVPAAVEAALKQNFPTVEKPLWDKENAHEYEAEFMLKGVKTSANFSDTGKWLETEMEITATALPKKVADAFHAKYAGAEITGAAKIETADNKIKYEAEFKTNGKKQEVLFDADGNLLKQ